MGEAIMTPQLLNTVDWRKYLIEDSDNPRIKRFLESRGNQVFTELTRAVNFANKNGRKKIVLIVHPNAGNAILTHLYSPGALAQVINVELEKNNKFD